MACQEPRDAYSVSPMDIDDSVCPWAASAENIPSRVSLACERCRQRKSKCDGNSPCGACRDRSTECRFRNPVPKAIANRAQAQILEGMAVMQNQLSALLKLDKQMQVRIGKLETSFFMLSDVDAMRWNPGSRDHLKTAHHQSLLSADRIEIQYSANEIPRNNVFMAGSRPVRVMAEDKVDAETGSPTTPGEPAIPTNHTTFSGLLLACDPIKHLTKHHVERVGIRHVNEFPISHEQNRGKLIVYDRGDVGGPNPTEPLSFRSGVPVFAHNPDFSGPNVWGYAKSFKETILNMHPIVQPSVLDEWVRQFLDSLLWEQPNASKPQLYKAFAVRGLVETTGVETTGSTRKRNPDMEHNEPTAAGLARAGRPNRSIHSALVLVILALGKICLHRDIVSDALNCSRQSMSPGNDFTIQNGISWPQYQHLPSGRSCDARRAQPDSIHDSTCLPPSRQQFMHERSRGCLDSPKGNHEKPPGLEYFALATDILGNHMGAYQTIKAVYANIFASLYHGQLMRPVESFAFIYRAGHKLQVLMRPFARLRDMRRSRTLPTETKSNQFALTFWTCLQIESDLLAELPLPPSGLLSYEEDIPHPNLSLMDGFDQRVLDSHAAQLYLRTQLDSIHRIFYEHDDESKRSPIGKNAKTTVLVDAVLGMNWVAPSIAFKENDPPAGDILGARLRGKYWGTQIMVYRPFIKTVLEFNYWQRPSSDLDLGTIELARKRIRALVESTRAFHSLRDELSIMTDVFGTAHAQWGNVLFLAAAYVDPILRDKVDEPLLKSLFFKIMRFLRQATTTASSLRLDLHVLKGLYRDLFSTQIPTINSSWSAPQISTAARSVAPKGA